MLRRTPGFLAASILSIALSIGASATMFSAFHAVFLRPLPYRDADRLVEIRKNAPDGADTRVTYADLQFWREHARSFVSLGAFGGFRMMAVTGLDEPVNLVVRAVSPGIFPTLASPSLRGRTLAPRDFES